MSRSLKLEMARVTGSINLFYAEVRKEEVVNGSPDQSWSGDVTDDPVDVFFSADGIGQPKYKVKISVNGIAVYENEYKLNGGYHEESVTV